VTLVIGVNFFPEIRRAAEEEDDIIHSSETFDDAVDFLLKLVKDFREPAGDNNYIVAKISLIFTVDACFVCWVISINE
jgi:hypothetical protein